MNSDETLQEILRRLESLNKEIHESPIPTSDDFRKRHLSDLVNTDDELSFYLKQLEDSHYIFVITIVEPIPSAAVPGTFGYVIAHSEIIQPLLTEYYTRLEHVYQAQLKKTKGAQTIVRELLPEIKQLASTPLGKTLNIAIMLDQFLRLMAEKPDEYTDYWKQVMLKRQSTSIADDSSIELQSIAGFEIEDTDINTQAPQPTKVIRRAIDTPEYQELSKMDLSGSWGKAVEKYGVTFLIRVHLRKMELDILRRLIQRKQIARQEDLKYLRDSLRVMVERFQLERQPESQIAAVRELNRVVQIQLNQFTLLQKQIENELDL